MSKNASATASLGLFQVAAKKLQHTEFPGGPPPQYYPLLKLCFNKEIKMKEMDMYCKAVDRAAADFAKHILLLEA
jgi:hypothetical protein